MSKKIFLILVLVTVSAFLFNSFCFAQRELEIEYPTVPGVETPTTVKTALPEYLRYIFTFAIIIAGLLAFGGLIYGGIRYLTSAGDPTRMKDAMEQVTAGILGLIILLSSYLILNTINPQLVLPTKPPLTPAISGIYVYVKAGCLDEPDDSSDDRVLINEDTPDLSERLPKDKNGTPQSLQCIEFRSGKEELTVKVYSNVNYSPEPPAPYEGDPGETKNVTGKSIKLDYHPPGVYLYASGSCAGDCPSDNCKIYQSSSATLPEFDGRTQSIKFVYDSEGEMRYAAILHEKENFMGEAVVAEPVESGDCIDLNALIKLNDPSNNKGVDLSNKVSSITVYLKPTGEPIGEGVKFWGDKNYTKEKDKIETRYYRDGEVVADLGSIDANDKITSMEIDGPYVALLFRDQNYQGDCEVFMSSCPDFRSHRIGQCGWLGRSDCLSSFIVKARK